jgi:two-component system alkaline phosphatase synthesis response regulator PhoP
MIKPIKKKILIVDDEEDTIEFLSYNFKKNGFEVITANNGLQGIDRTLACFPDVIIADIMMPNMNGLIMGKILKSYSESDNIPIIFLSATQSDYQVIDATMLGDDYISKPIKFSLLLPIVQKHLSKEKTPQ